MSKYSCDQLGLCHCGRCNEGLGLPTPKRPLHWRRLALTALRWVWHLLSVLCVVIVMVGTIGMLNADDVQLTHCICQIDAPEVQP